MSDYLTIETEGGTVYAPDFAAVASLWKKMAAAMKSVGAIQESGRNTHDQYSYSSADDVMAPVKRAMSEQNLSHAMQITEVEQSPGSKGIRTLLKVQAIIGDGDTGAFLVSNWAAEAVDFGMADKGINKATTTAQKYWLKRTFLLATKEDIENDSDSVDRPPEGENAPPPTRRAEAKGHVWDWTQDADKRHKFMEGAMEHYDLTDKEILQALDVTSLDLWRGSMTDAKGVIDEWKLRQIEKLPL